MNTQPSQTRADPGFVRKVIIVIALVALALLAWQLRSLLIMIFGAVVIAVLFRSLASAIQRFTHLPNGPSLLLAVLLIAFILAGAILLFGGQILAQAEGLTKAVPLAWESLKERLAGFGIGAQLDQLVGNSQSGGL